MMISGEVCLCLQSSGNENESLFSILIGLLFSEFTGLRVHWNYMAKTQVGDLIYENSFKPFTTLTNPVQAHRASSKVALSLFIGFQLHQHSTPEPSCWTKDTADTDRHEFFLRDSHESSLPQTGANR